MKIDWGLVQAWMQIIGITSIMALGTAIAKIWRIVIGPIKAEIEKIQKSRETESFRVSEQLQADLVKFINLEKKVDKNTQAVESTKESVSENIQEIKKDISEIKTEVTAVGKQVANVEGQLKIMNDNMNKKQ